MQPTFLPVVSELIHAQLSQRNQGLATHAGETLVATLPLNVTDSTQLQPRTIEGPPPADADYGAWEWVASQSSVVWNWREPPGAGIYSLDIQNEPAWMIATSAPSIESDLSASTKRP